MQLLYKVLLPPQCSSQSKPVLTLQKTSLNTTAVEKSAAGWDSEGWQGSALLRDRGFVLVPALVLVLEAGVAKGQPHVLPRRLLSLFP